MKKLYAKLKTFIDIWKMWLFFGALLFGTNGAQMYVHSEPEKVGPPIEKAKPVAVGPQKTIIIHKFDTKLAEKLIKQELDKHKTGAQH